MAGLASQLANVLTADDLDRVQEGVGDTEQQVAHSVLILASIPSLTIPFLFQLFKKNIYLGVVLVWACLIGFYFIIQHRLPWIITFGQRLKTLYDERIRI